MCRYAVEVNEYVMAVMQETVSNADKWVGKWVPVLVSKVTSTDEEQVGDGQGDETDDGWPFGRPGPPRTRRVPAVGDGRPGSLRRRGRRSLRRSRGGEPSKYDYVADGSERQDDWDDDAVDIVTKRFVPLHLIVGYRRGTWSVVGVNAVERLVVRRWVNAVCLSQQWTPTVSRIIIGFILKVLFFR